MPAYNQAAVFTDQKNVVTPGTPLQLPSHQIPDGSSVTITARPTNTQNVYLGKSSADALDTAKRFTLLPGDSIDADITNTNLFWVDAQVATEGVDIVGTVRG